METTFPSRPDIIWQVRQVTGSDPVIFIVLELTKTILLIPKLDLNLGGLSKDGAYPMRSPM
jgi:hypothetical protein